MDFQAYLASGSSDEGEDEEATEGHQIQKYRVCVNLVFVCVWWWGGGEGGEQGWPVIGEYLWVYYFLLLLM